MIKRISTVFPTLKQYQGLCAGEQAMRSDSIVRTAAADACMTCRVVLIRRDMFAQKQVMHRRALVLFAHFHSPESPFAMLPLELVGHIVGSITTMGCPGFDDHYLVRFSSAITSQTFSSFLATDARGQADAKRDQRVLD